MSVPSFDEVPSDFLSTNPDGTPQRPAAEPYLHPIAVVFHLLFKVRPTRAHLAAVHPLTVCDRVRVVAAEIVCLC